MVVMMVQKMAVLMAEIKVGLTVVSKVVMMVE